MTKTCSKGHVLTEENTSWVKRGDRPGLRRRCLDCQYPNRAKRTGTDNRVQPKLHRHEDVEDLLEYGAVYEDLFRDSTYAHYNSLYKSLKKAGREDLIERVKAKKVQAKA